MTVSIPLIIMGLLLDTSFYYISCSLIALVVSFGLWCNYKGFYTIAKTIIISSNSILILLT